ncbi:MAG: hypothetical protein ACRBI6_17665 [Acidimicrobiales bacterium]
MERGRTLLVLTMLLGACGSSSEAVGGEEASTASSELTAAAPTTSDASDISEREAEGEPSPTEEAAPAVDPDPAEPEPATSDPLAYTVPIDGGDAGSVPGAYCETLASMLRVELPVVLAGLSAAPPEIAAAAAEVEALLRELDDAMADVTTQAELDEIVADLPAELGAIVDDLEALQQGEELGDGPLGAVMAHYDETCHSVVWSDLFSITTVDVARADSEAEANWPLSGTVSAWANDGRICLEGLDRATMADVFGDQASVTVLDADGAWALSVTPDRPSAGFVSIACAIN